MARTQQLTKFTSLDDDKKNNDQDDDDDRRSSNDVQKNGSIVETSENARRRGA